MAGRDEVGLVARARDGELAAFEELIGPHEKRVYRAVLRITRHAEDAADVYQTASLAAFEKLSGFRAEAAFGTWLYQIAVNATLMHRRSRSRDPVMLGEDESMFDWMGRHADPVRNWAESAEDTVARGQLREALSRAFDGLPDTDRAIVWLKDGEGLNHAEIAATTGLTVLAVRTRLHRARLRLRSWLAKDFGSKR
jgi:RNA polymerase sigma-70 factor (ECF subfamily)